MKRTLLFRGTGTAIVTPMKRGGAVDEHSLKELVEFQIKSGVEALLPAGTTGEGATLTEDEQARVAHLVVSQAKGRVKVIAGAGSNSTRKAVLLSRRMMEEGADAVLSVVPYYNKPTQEGLYRHFGEIASVTPGPIVLYNVPGRTSSNLEASTVLRLAADFPSIAGIKEASGNFSQVMEILRRRPRGFGVWSGDDALVLPLVALGADGVISVVANQVPRRFSTMVRLALRGNFRRAAALHYQLLDLMNVNFIESNPIPVKAALAMMGMLEEEYRLPLVPLSLEHRKKLKEVLHRTGIIR